MKIRKVLYPIREGGNYELLPACYILTSSDLKHVIDLLNDIKVLDGYIQYISAYYC